MYVGMNQFKQYWLKLWHIDTLNNIQIIEISYIYVYDILG